MEHERPFINLENTCRALSGYRLKIATTKTEANDIALNAYNALMRVGRELGEDPRARIFMRNHRRIHAMTVEDTTIEYTEIGSHPKVAWVTTRESRFEDDSTNYVKNAGRLASILKANGFKPKTFLEGLTDKKIYQNIIGHYSNNNLENL